MSAPIVELTVLTASLLGSLHCTSMCGGIVLALAPTWREAVPYHLGRLVAYSSLGAGAAFLGGKLLGAAMLGAVAQAVSIFFVIVLSFLGLRIIIGRPLHIRMPGPVERVTNRLWARAMKARSHAPARFGLGLLSGLLPCGWLYSFVAGAALTQRPLSGAIAMALFWAGTLPALTLAPGIIQRIFKPLRRTAPRLAGTLLVAAGLFSVALHFKALEASRAPAAPTDQIEHKSHSCH